LFGQQIRWQAGPMSGRHRASAVADVMTSTVHVAGADLPLLAPAPLMTANGEGALPVMDGARPCDRAAVGGGSLARSREPGPVKKANEYLAPSATRVEARNDGGGRHVRTSRHSHPTTPVREAAKLMRDRQVRHLPVVDADGRLRGIVSRADLLRVFLRHDRDIIRQIVAEVLPRASWLESGHGDVRVDAGVVRLRGGLERRSQALLIERLANGVEGVVDVRSELRWSGMISVRLSRPQDPFNRSSDRRREPDGSRQVTDATYVRKAHGRTAPRRVSRARLSRSRVGDFARCHSPPLTPGPGVAGTGGPTVGAARSSA
jgi:CBS domain-containing protein